MKTDLFTPRPTYEQLERAAILEYDAKLSREEAERRVGIPQRGLTAWLSDEEKRAGVRKP